jgi:hypothetical protein
MSTSIQERMLTSSLEQYCARLEELCTQVRRSLPTLSAELLDEVAGTIGELMLVLIQLQNAHPAEETIRHAVSDAQQIREAVRTEHSQHDEIALAVNLLMSEVDQIIHDEKQAA